MTGKEITILSEQEVRLAVPWPGEEGFWHEDYAKEKAEMLDAASETIKSQFDAVVSSGVSRYLHRKFPSLNKYLLQYPIRNISIRRAVFDIPLKVNEPGTQFMEVQGDLLVLRFPDMKEIAQFMEALSERLGGVKLELRKSPKYAVHYELYMEAILCIR